MIEEEKSNNYFIKIIFIFFLCFMLIYISHQTGFYEYQTYKKTQITKEAMSKFESDISKGKDVSINDYIENEFVDYSNPLTKMGSKINRFVESFMNKGIKKTLKVLKRLFYE